MAANTGAGPTDAELEAAVAWVWAQGDPLDPLSSLSNHQCALAALLEWYLRNRPVVAAARDVEEASYSWDTREAEPGSPMARLREALAG